MMKHVHKFPLKLDKLSQDVFSLDNDYKIILRCIALNGPSPKARIIDYIKNSDEEEYSRTTLDRKLNGSNKVLGLVEKEYLAATKGLKRRWGTQQIYHLTVKGLLAALSNGDSLNKIYLYEQFIFLSSNFLRNQNLIKIVEEFITNEIYAFLSWHAYNGIQLQKLINSQKYYENISKILWDKETYWGNIDPKTLTHLQKIWNAYHISSDAISILNKSNFIFSRKTIPTNYKKEIPSFISKGVWDIGFNWFIFNWTKGMSILHTINFDQLKNMHQESVLNRKEIIKFKSILKTRLEKKGYSGRDLKIIGL